MTQSANKEDQEVQQWAAMKPWRAIWNIAVLAFHKWKWYRYVRKYYRSGPRVKIISFHKWDAFRLLANASYEDDLPQLTISLGFGAMVLTSPYRSRFFTDGVDGEQYGVYYHANSFWFCWGRKHWVLYMPWDRQWVRTSLLLKDGTWADERKGDRLQFWDDKIWEDTRWQQSYPYTYTLQSGEVQHRQATLTIKEMEWRMRWLMWTPLFAQVSRTIEVRFNKEVGERTGSYKGGTMGCAYELREGEDAEQCLRRMEKERKFN